MKRMQLLVGLFAFCLLPVAMLPGAPLGIAGEGKIVPAEGLIQVAAPAGETGVPLVSRLLVEEGQLVKAGDPLAELATKALLETDVAAAGASLALAQGAEALLQARVEELDKQVKTAEARQVIAEKQLAEAKAAVHLAEQSRLQALAELDAGVDYIQGQIAEHQRVLDELSPPRREAEEIRFQQAVLRLETKKNKASRAALDARLTAEVDRAQAAVETADAQWRASGAEVESVGVAKATVLTEIKRAEAEVAVAQAALEQAKARLRLGTVLAPLDGQILAVNARTGEAVGPQGLLLMGDTSRMYVEAEIYIDDISRLKVGQTARITGDSFRDTLMGKVETIGLIVAPNEVFSPDPAAFADRRVIKTRIALDDSAAVKHLSNATVQVRIQP